MRVLVTADTVGGVWTYTRELVTGLAKRGVEVTLVSFGEIPTNAQSEWLDALPGVDFRATAFKLEWMQESADDLIAASEFLRDIIAEKRPDLLHFSQYCFGAMDTAVPKVVVAHSDVVSWWVTVHGEEPPTNEWIKGYREVVQRGLDGADTVVAPSKWMLGQINELYGTRKSGTVIYNGRNPGLFNPHVGKDDLVIAVGRLWDKAKQVSLLMDASHKVPVWIAGEEQHPDSAFRSDQKLRARGVRFCGKQSEAQLRQLFSRASIYAATSRYEPFGLAPLEAALSRCAIVANDIPTFHELWGETALYFQHNDARDLARKLERLQNDPELRMTYANLAYGRARQRFTAERMVDDYMNLYQTLVPAGVAVA
ncbi:MAG TPA: glycosyltransferase family 4 protein [Terriglobales bacterium]|nr:glycosyltransferase family 4 protein [Terriglobales bacterium]